MYNHFLWETISKHEDTTFQNYVRTQSIHPSSCAHLRFVPSHNTKGDERGQQPYHQNARDDLKRSQSPDYRLIRSGRIKSVC